MTDLTLNLESLLGERLRLDRESRAKHSRDTWVLSELDDLNESEIPLPLAVAEPENAQEVSAILRACRDARVAVVPYGGGSGVCGAIRGPAGALVVSTARMDGLVSIDSHNLVATFRAGTNGMEAERAVQKEGLTIGQWPQSIELSTVGGWVATRAAGQFSTAYGSIEDMLLDLEAVLPNGEILRTRRTPRAAAGPDLRQLFLGSEGTLGIVTEVSFSLRALPACQRGQAFHFADLKDAIDPIRRVLRDGWRPPVVRLYDAPESHRHFHETCPEGRAMLIFLHEGPERLVDVQSEAVAQTCQAAGGTAADASSVDKWLANRNHVPGFRSFLEKGIILDTIEVACLWDQVTPLYERVTSSLREVPGILLASGHSSHSYRSGTNLYFTFVARPDDAGAMADTYRECWKRTIDATLAVGGGISHHHGIGRVRRDALPQEIGQAGIDTLRAIKHALDPENLFNPGALLPPISA